jgi:polysaccharide biosynthesis transport protein
MAENENQLKLAGVLAFLRRRKWQIIVPAFLCTLLTTVVVANLTKVYTASAWLLLDARQENVTNVAAVLVDALPDQETIDSEMQVLRSRDLAAKVIKNLNLNLLPEFNPQLRQPSVFEPVAEWIRLRLRHLFGSELEAVSEDTKASLERAAVTKEFLDRLSVTQYPNSRVLIITFDSENRELAARVVDELTAAYTSSNLDAKFDATSRANAWLSTKLNELRQQAEVSERAVEKFRNQAGLLQGAEGVPLVAKQLSDLNSELIAARAQRVSADTRVQQVRALIRSGGNAAATADVLGSPIITNLVAQETEQKRALAQFAEEYGPRHPQLINANAALRDLQAKIKTESTKILQSMENEANVANAREAAVQTSLKQLEARLGTANSDQVKLRALEREADAQRGLLQDFLARYQETRAQMDISAERQNARVISRPDIPDEPSFPRTMLIAAAAFVGSMLLFTVIVLGIEDMDAGLRSGEQVEQLIGERSLGLVTRTGRRQAPQVWLRKNPASEFADSIRSLYTRLMLIDRRKTSRTLLVTSSLPGEGKSSLVFCLAMYRAMAGQKVLMVDADMRRPSLHLIANASREPGLADGLKWDGVAEMVRPLNQPNLYLLPAGRPVSDATDVLRSPSLAHVFEEIEADYDFVIIDSPPLVGFSDAVLIAPFVDMHLLAVRWGKTPCEVVKLAAKQMREAGCGISGIVLTMVNPRKHAQYSFADSAHYSSSIRRYYTT